MKSYKSRKKEAAFQESIIEKILRTSGYAFPLTDNELKEFEKLFGTTEIILPPELNDPTFLFERPKKKSKNEKKKNDNINFAMAAREGLPKLPKEIQQKIVNDIKATKAKGKKKRK